MGGALFSRHGVYVEGAWARGVTLSVQAPPGWGQGAAGRGKDLRRRQEGQPGSQVSEWVKAWVGGQAGTWVGGWLAGTEVPSTKKNIYRNPLRGQH